MTDFRDRDRTLGSLHDLSAIAGKRMEVRRETEDFLGQATAILTEEQIRQMEMLLVGRERWIVLELASLKGPLTLEMVEHLHTEAKSIMILRQVTNRLKPKTEGD